MVFSLQHISKKPTLTFNYTVQSLLSGDKLEGRQTLGHIWVSHKGSAFNQKQTTEQRQTSYEQFAIKWRPNGLCCVTLHFTPALNFRESNSTANSKYTNRECEETGWSLLFFPQGPREKAFPGKAAKKKKSMNNLFNLKSLLFVCVHNKLQVAYWSSHWYKFEHVSMVCQKRIVRKTWLPSIKSSGVLLSSKRAVVFPYWSAGQCLELQDTVTSWGRCLITVSRKRVHRETLVNLFSPWLYWDFRKTWKELVNQLLQWAVTW